MKKQLKNREDLFDYLMHGYVYELEDVPTKMGIQKRLRDNELEQELKEKTKENVKVEDLNVELKLGPSYNRTKSVWIQIFTDENKSGTKGRYVGISFEKDTNEIAIWLGFGKTGRKKNEILELSKEYKLKYSLIEPTLKNGFSYVTDGYEPFIIRKKIKMNNFKDADFVRDIKYITDLYKTYETRFENAIISATDEKTEEAIKERTKKYEQLNERLLDLIEEAGNIAKEIKKIKREEERR